MSQHGWTDEDLADYNAAQETQQQFETTLKSLAVARTGDVSEVDSLRTQESAKLDQMEVPLWRTLNDPKVTSGQMSQAVYAILKVMERRAKLLGLDLHTGVNVNFSQVEIVYKDKASGAVIDAPDWVVADAGDD